MKWIFSVITLWLIFVLSLSTWWMIFGLQTLDLLASGQVEEGAKILRQQKMLFYEGSVLAIFQVLGAVGLFYFAFRMYQEKAATEKFFASFAHDIKTSLFRLQLHAEGMDVAQASEKNALLSKARHLQLNLENGLNSVLGGRKNLFFEKISMSELVEQLHIHWPELQIELQGESVLWGDRKALTSIFENLVHNSYFHGKAEKVTLSLESKSGMTHVEYSDTGSPFQGDLKTLGAQPAQSEKGSGFGLYLVRFWVKKMKGKIQFSTKSTGQLVTSIQLPEAS